MKLKAGKADYGDLPPIGMLDGVTLDTGVREMRGHYYALCRVSPEEISRWRAKDEGKDSRGRPVYFALTDEGALMLYPAPDADDDLIIRYYPPMKEF